MIKKLPRLLDRPSLERENQSLFQALELLQSAQAYFKLSGLDDMDVIESMSTAQKRIKENLDLLFDKHY